jgi:hypothetical protein
VGEISEGVRGTKLKRDSSFVNIVGTGPGEVRTETELWSWRNLYGGELTVRNCCGES